MTYIRCLTVLSLLIKSPVGILLRIPYLQHILHVSVSLQAEPSRDNLDTYLLAAYCLTHLPLDKMPAILADYIFKCIFFNENVWISIKISLDFLPKGPIDNKPALVQVMAWRHPGHKPLSETMLVSLLMHICFTRAQWVDKLDMGPAIIICIFVWF